MAGDCDTQTQVIGLRCGLSSELAAGGWYLVFTVLDNVHVMVNRNNRQ